MISGFGLEYPGLFAVRHPRWAAALLAVLLLATMIAVPKLRFDENLERTFAAKSSLSQTYAQFLRELSTKPEDIIFLVETRGAFTASDYKKMREFALDLQLSSQVISVLSPFSARFPKTHEQFPAELVFPEKLQLENISKRLAAYQASGVNFRPLIAKGSTTAIIIASIDFSKKFQGPGTLMESLKAMAKRYSVSNVRYTLAGKRAASIDLIESIKFDLIALNALGTILAAILGLLIFRGFRNACVAILPAIMGALVSLSVFVWFNFPVTVVSNVIPILVLVLGLADSVHLTMHFKSDTTYRPLSDRIAETVTDVGPACALTTLTTAIAFIAIAISNNDQLYEFAVTGCVAVLISQVVVIMTFVLIAPFADRTAKGESANLNWLRVPDFVPRAVFNHSGTIIAGSLVLAVVCGWGYLRTEPWFSFDRNLPENSEVRRANEIIQDRFGGMYRVWAEIDASGENSLERPAGWMRLTQLTKAIETAAPGTPVVSLVSLARWLGSPNALPTPKQLKDIPDYLKGQLYNREKKVARVIVFVPEPMRNHATLAAHDRIVNAATGNGATRVTGLPIVLRHESLSIVNQLSTGLVIACVIAIIAIGAAFRWPMLSVILFVPNLLPLLATASAVHILNFGKIDPVAVLTLTIAFGIAVDDSIHLINAYCLHRQNGHGVDKALRMAIERTGRVMIATTLLISVGMLSTLVSQFSTVRLFGELLIIALAIALILDMLLLPALLRQKWVRR